MSKNRTVKAKMIEMQQAAKATSSPHEEKSGRRILEDVGKRWSSPRLDCELQLFGRVEYESNICTHLSKDLLFPIQDLRGRRQRKVVGKEAWHHLML